MARSVREERPCWSHKWFRAMEQKAPDLAAEARQLNRADCFDMAKLRDLNRQRKLRQQERRDTRALVRSRAQHRDLDEAAWWRDRRAKQGDIDSDSTADTTSSSSDSSELDSTT